MPVHQRVADTEEEVVPLAGPEDDLQDFDAFDPWG